ncbi:MAG: penicillin acylase family protein [Candidatus Helarchaeota archaeon]
MKGIIIKEIIAAVVTIGFIILLTMSFGLIPALGNFLNPFGVWTVPTNARYTDMTISDARLGASVTVQFDEYGVPHIYAQTDADLYFALGYLHAYNRLFEMDIFRRAPAGRLAEILGDSFLSADKYFRILGFNRAAVKATAYMQENQTFFYNLLMNYSNGINKFIDSITPMTLPLEYKLLGITPERWTPQDTILIKYLQSWDLSGTMADLDTTLLREKLPTNVYDELYPNYTIGMEPFQEPIIPYDEYTILEEDSALVNTITALKTLESSRLHLFGSQELGLGSNNWAVNGSKSTTGTPLLAGDPHLGYQQPSLWYEAQMVSNEGYNCTGIGFPGTPIILIGHNDHVAWSLTNIGSDTFVDFYEELMNETHYYFNGAWHPLQIFNEEISVKGGANVPIQVRETIHGPLITDHNLVTDMAARGFNTVNISLKWVGLNVPYTGNFSNELIAGYKWNKATDFTSFNDGLRYFGGMQNIVYADDYGTIAMTITGPYPIRKQGVAGAPNPTLRGDVIQNGTGNGEEWDSFIPFNKLPREVNPTRCWVASNNQPTINGSYPYYIGENTFDEGYRARRIHTLLESKAKLDLNDFKNFQLDIYSLSASEFLPFLLNAWNYSVNVNGTIYDATTNAAMNELFLWNQSSQRYQFNKTLIAPTIFEHWFRTFKQNTWDEFSTWDAAGLRLPPNGILENLTKCQPDSIWFDDNSTLGTVETLNYTLLKSFNDTIAYLQNQYGAMSNWVWGDVHKIYIEHLTGMSALSSPKIPIDGYGDSLNAQWGQGGPSMRMVVNLGNSTRSDTSFLIYPSGQSGNPVSSHYFDLFNSYVENQYHNVYRSTLPTVEATWTFSP